MESQSSDWTPTVRGCEMSDSDMTPIQSQTQGREGSSLLFRFSDSPLTRAGWLMTVHPDGVTLETAGLRTSHRMTWGEFHSALVKWDLEDLPALASPSEDPQAPASPLDHDLPPRLDDDGPRVPHSTAQALMDSMTMALKSDPSARVDFPWAGEEGEDDDIF